MSVSRVRPEDRDDRLVAAATAALNADPGASMASIAEAAGVGRATLHRRFATRDDLVVELGTRAFARWEAALQDSGALALAEDDGTADPAAHRAALEDLVRRFVREAADYSFAITHPDVERHPALVDACARLIALDVRVLTAAQRAGVLRDDVPAEWIDHVLFGLLRSGLDAVRYGDVAPRAIPDLVLTTFFAAVGR
jgi:AcrR family transcriptional regulator